MTLKSERLTQSSRLKEAGNTPFHSMSERDDGSTAVVILNDALADIASGSPFLPNRLLPRPFGPNGPPGVAWGPFFNIQSNTLDPVNIRRFQRQAGDLDIDGKAGMQTLNRLDEIMVHLETARPVSSGTDV
jgi:hypothetical protein